ncbi:MAG: hypothetical protein HN742_28660 [Lentisphaerae bacterium]|jgi:hypothetical protein|nr:hypothetical protein [Lentisphaerota bacterium]MBT4817835.1 hypothetical protein [Lentisphaerota bacterium]MBT5612236.1 hypothetical protein [Lentisphaerota bacterium]MBT7845879.1 hypothetical protein [Lentisphaerota bacterium]
MTSVVAALLRADDPCVRYRALVDVCGIAPDSKRACREREAIRSSTRVGKLLSPHSADGRVSGVYSKYTGAHWALADLADIGYPPGDTALIPLRDQVYEYWLDPVRTRERVVDREAARYKSRPGVPIIDGRARRCASQEGNALYATLALGLADDRTDQLAANLTRWQWPDGGWNCDRKTSARTSSFHETLLPLRGLAWHAKLTGSEASSRAVDACCEFLLERKLFKRRHDGSVIHGSFLRLRYPHYWHYDILIALKVMAEAGRIGDCRCAEALDLVESRQLPDGGWRAEGKHYRVVDEPANGGSMVDWGPVSRRKVMNPFVTLDALHVLRAAGRLSAAETDVQN